MPYYTDVNVGPLDANRVLLRFREPGSFVRMGQQHPIIIPWGVARQLVKEIQELDKSKDKPS